MNILVYARRVLVFAAGRIINALNRCVAALQAVAGTLCIKKKDCCIEDMRRRQHLCTPCTHLLTPRIPPQVGGGGGGGDAKVTYIHKKDLREVPTRSNRRERVRRHVLNVSSTGIPHVLHDITQKMGSTRDPHQFETGPDQLGNR